MKDIKFVFRSLKKMCLEIITIAEDKFNVIDSIFILLL